MKRKKLSARILSLVLTVAMVCTMLPATVFATEGYIALGVSSLECHVEHDKDCGYVAAVEGTPCSHKNEDGTYSCASDTVSDNTATPGDADKTTCTHEDDCGYVEAAKGVDCKHTCEKCDVKDSGETNKKSAVEQSAYDKVVELFKALPNASVINRETTDEEKDAIIAQLTEAMEAFEALTADEQALFMKEQATLYKVAMALNDAITGAPPMTLTAGVIPPFVEGTNTRYKSGETFKATELKIGDRIEVGAICNEGGNQLGFDSYELFLTGGLELSSGPYGNIGTASETPLTILDRYPNANGSYKGGATHVSTRTEWVKYGEDVSGASAPFFTSADKTVVNEYDVTVGKTGLTGAAAKFEIELAEGNKLVEGDSFKVADYDTLRVILTPDNGGSFRAAPTVTVDSGATAGTVTKDADSEVYTCEITSFTGNTTITVAGTAESAGVSVDKTALSAAVTAATTNKNSVETSTDGKDVDPSNKWVTIAVKTAYETQIAAAQTVATKDGATQAEVDAAVTALATATTTFNNAKADGTKPALVTKYAITFANPTNGTLVATVDGSTITSGNEVESGKTVTFTVTPNSGYEVDTWSGATAGTPNTKATLTVSAAATVSVTLKATPADKTALTTAITAATTNKDSVETSTDGTDVAPPKKWVTEAVKTAYNNAITAAQTVATKAGATQAEVDAAVTALATATTTFNNAKADGTKPAPVTKYAITFANPTNGTLAATVDGSTITSGTEVAAGKTVTFTVTPNSGYEVDTWSGATAGTPNTKGTLTVSAAATVSVTLKAVSETDQQIADRVAALITSITVPDKDATTLTLPTVSDGCTIAIKSSSNEAVISLNGTITPPDAETEVTLVLTVTKGSATADTISIKVKVPAKSTAIPDKSALTDAIASAKSIMANTVISVQSGSDISPSSYWVLPDIMSAAKTALSEAEAVLANPNATQAEIANAAVKLNAKVNIDFKNAKKPGTKSNSSSDSGSSSGGGGSSSSGNTPSIVPPNTTQPTQPNPPTTVETKVPATVDNKGNATVNVTDKTMQDAIDKAVSEAKKNGTSGNGISVVISVTTDGKNANTVTVNLPKTVQEKVIAGKVLNTVVVVDRPDISINMNLATITEINKQAKSDVQLSATRMDNTKLSGDAKTAIGNRPTFDLKAIYASGSKAISNFGTGNVTVGIPYTLQAGEVASGLYAVYVDGNGKVTYLTNSSYDANAKQLRFSTNHFSVYGIGYKAPTGFTDIANHWAKSDIEFVVNRGLFSGTSATTFSPDGAMTRGMFVTALGRLTGIDVNAYKTNKFTDVKADAYYAPYANWAASKGITNGTTATTFAPDTLISRQEMAVMISNYAKALGYTVPQTRAANTFADNANIASGTADAVKQMQMAGILNGKNSNRFDPTGTATRGEISAMLRRYVELVIDRVTTEGWTTNDSGSGMYYQNGKALVGAQTIAGVAYTFNTYGETTGKTTTAGATTTNPALPTESKKHTLYTVKKNDWISKIALAHNCTVEEILALNNITNKDLIYEGQQIKIPQK